MVFGVKASSSQVLKSWWVVAFCSLVAVGYAQAMKGRNSTLAELQFRMTEMEKEKRLALLEKEDLNDRIASQGDPAWIEMVLLKELGVVPEGFLKVHFKK